MEMKVDKRRKNTELRICRYANFSHASLYFQSPPPPFFIRHQARAQNSSQLTNVLGTPFILFFMSNGSRNGNGNGKECRLYELQQFMCENHESEENARIKCYPLPRIFYE